LGLSGFALSIGGTIWAMILNVPTPIAVMAGYCTLVGAVYLALAPLAYRALVNQSTTPKGPETIAPNYAIWRHRETIYLGDAACLFAELVPDANNKQKPQVREFLGALIDAARNDEIDFIYRSKGSVRTQSIMDHEKAMVDSTTQVERNELKAFAKKRDYDPMFLRDSA